MEPTIKSKTNSAKVSVDFEAWQLINEEKHEILSISLKPGEKIASHPNPFIIIFYVLEGQGELTIDQRNYELKKGECIEVPAGLNREWQNKSKGNLSLLVIKVKE